MRQFRIFNKRIILSAIFCVQVVFCIVYFILRIDSSSKSIVKGSFLRENEFNQVPFVKRTYHTYNDKIYLKKQSTDSEFIDFNMSICYKNGTDVKLMVDNKNKDKWNCKCLPMFHGNNCGQPEVIWRALLNYRSPTNIKGPRKHKRHILSVIKVDKFLTLPLEILTNELNEVVDVFILFENTSTSNLYLKKLLDSGFLKKFHDKILYFDVKNDDVLLSNIQKHFDNINEDSLVIFINRNEIINKEALQFLKLYDNWPEPLNFRLRWLIYGYFWLHPEKTILKSNVFTLAFLNANWNQIKRSLFINNTKIKFTKKQLIIGDLNHYGGWFCQYCFDPLTIIDYLNTKNETVIQEKNVKIDQEYLEDLIGNGIYIDGKTELERVHRSRELYFAPEFVIQNEWNYDWLLLNLYSQLDY